MALNVILHIRPLRVLTARCWPMKKVATYFKDNWITFILINGIDLGVFLMPAMFFVQQQHGIT